MVIIFILLVVVALIFAISSMKDFQIPREVHRMTTGRRKRGTFIVFKNKVTHYKKK